MPTPWEFIFLIQGGALSPLPPAVSFEFAAATEVSVLESGGWGGGSGGSRAKPAKQSYAKPFSVRLSKNDTN